MNNTFKQIFEQYLPKSVSRAARGDSNEVPNRELRGVNEAKPGNFKVNIIVFFKFTFL
jgi:hypothetical protein